MAMNEYSPGLLLLVFVPAVSHSHSPSLLETFQYYDADLAQSLMGLLLFPLGPGVHKTWYVSSKSEVFVSPSSVEVLQSNPVGPQR